MSAISFKLEVFEGPLDLLLHLIAKHKLDINDIEISKLLEQYLAYIDECSANDLELAGEFLEMAARLIYIKTVSLLPCPEETEDVKKELQGALIEYSLCKIAAKRLGEAFCGNDIFVRHQMKIKADMTYNRVHETGLLVELYNGISLKNKKKTDAVSEDRFQVIVKHRMVSVTTKVVFILRKLYASETVDMDVLYDGITDRSERVATFLAVLELTKSGRIILNEDNSQLSFAGRVKTTTNKTERILE